MESGLESVSEHFTDIDECTADDEKENGAPSALRKSPAQKKAEVQTRNKKLCEDALAKALQNAKAKNAADEQNHKPLKEGKGAAASA